MRKPHLSAGLALAGAVLGASHLAPLQAQDLLEGNGLGTVYMGVSAAELGGVIDVNMGAENYPNQVLVLSVSGSFANNNSPIWGPVALDTTNPLYFILVYQTDANGEVNFQTPWPLDPALLFAPPLYANALTIENNQFAFSKTVRVSFMWPDGWDISPSMSQPRAGHEAIALGDGPLDDRTKVFISGGGEGTIIVPLATKSTELYNPTARTFEAGPDMSVERIEHRAVRLDDGKVLITGGCDTAGVVHSSCEIYDHDAGTITPVASMNEPRLGHQISLLNDGRVLVTGGFSDWQNAGTQFVAVLNTAQRSAEVYDPQTDTWTPLADMQDDRGGHEHVTLADGRVLVISGINGGQTDPTFGGGQWPSFTATCDYFDPTTDSFSPAPSLVSGPFLLSQGRGFFGASLLGDGTVLLTGGMYDAGQSVGAANTSECMLFDGVSWTTTGSLPLSIAGHKQLTLPSGEAFLSGGWNNATTLTGVANAGYHDGTVYTASSGIGENAGLPGSFTVTRGNHTMTQLYDGTLIVLGGSDGFSVRQGGHIINP
jgi:hypothetical protein